MEINEEYESLSFASLDELPSDFNYLESSFKIERAIVHLRVAKIEMLFEIKKLQSHLLKSMTSLENSNSLQSM